MIKFQIRNKLTNQYFEKKFENIDNAITFLIKCKYSKKIKIINYITTSISELEEIHKYAK